MADFDEAVFFSDGVHKMIKEDYQEFAGRITAEPEIMDRIQTVLGSWICYPLKNPQFYILRDTAFPQWIGVGGSRFFFDYCCGGPSSESLIKAPKIIISFLQKCKWAYGLSFSNALSFSKSAAALSAYYYSYNSESRSAIVTFSNSSENVFSFDVKPNDILELMAYFIDLLPKVEEIYGVKVDRKAIIDMLKNQVDQTGGE